MKCGSCAQGVQVTIPSPLRSQHAPAGARSVVKPRGINLLGRPSRPVWKWMRRLRYCLLQLYKPFKGDRDEQCTHAPGARGGGDRYRGADRIAGTDAPRVGSPRSRASHRSTSRGRSPGPVRPAGRGRDTRGGGRHPTRDRHHHRLDPQGHRGGEHRGQQPHPAQSVRRSRTRRRRAPRRPADRTEALPRTFRGLRHRREGRDALPRGRSPGCPAPTSTTRRRTSCSRPPSGWDSRGASTARTRSSASRSTTP